MLLVLWLWCAFNSLFSYGVALQITFEVTALRKVADILIQPSFQQFFLTHHVSSFIMSWIKIILVGLFFALHQVSALFSVAIHILIHWRTHKSTDKRTCNWTVNLKACRRRRQKDRARFLIFAEILRQSIHFEKWMRDDESPIHLRMNQLFSITKRSFLRPIVPEYLNYVWYRSTMKPAKTIWANAVPAN